MNAGVAEAIVPREFNEIVYEFEVLRCHDGQLNILNFRNDEVFWEYRHSKGWQPGIILTVTMAWPMQPDKDLKTKVRAANQMRLQKQPLKEPSCGSTFRNPPGNSAGRLIEQAGLKGFKVGGAEVSRKHANFIVTSEGATAKDVNAVMDHIVKTVEDKFSISLQSEVVKLGQW
ncbi:MAG: hypothetical protein KDD40_04215, partial [Bdellovibrionales bacterium]|nr:hypothetical protein [Bdellovibrionales bacterium]